jgi:hypothetical protein
VVRQSARLSAIGLIQGRSFVHRDVVRLIALDFILRVILAGAVHMSFVINTLQVDLMILPLTYPASEFQVT